jgi:hypothetical protein
LVEPPDHQRVAGPELVEEPIELRPSVESTGSRGSKHLEASGGRERIELKGSVLIDRRHPGIPD